MESQRAVRKAAQMAVSLEYLWAEKMVELSVVRRVFWKVGWKEQQWVADSAGSKGGM